MLAIALMSGKDLGQPVVLEDFGSLEHRPRKRLHFVVQAIARESKHKDGVLNRPNRSAMIGEWIECRMLRRQCAYAPTRKHVRPHEPLGKPRRQTLINNSRGETMPGI